MAQSFLRTPTVDRLPNILRDLHRGMIQIPSFQRPFLWSDEQRLHLLDSIRQGLPIGSFMVWRTSKQIRYDPVVGPYRLSYPEPRPGETMQYLLDGRQRLTTLYAALGLALYLESETEPVQSTLHDAEDWPIFYHLVDQDFVQRAAAESTPKYCMPAHLLIDSFSRQGWLRENLGQDKSARIYWNRAETLSARFNDYLVPIVPIVSDNIEQVSESFKRINQNGTSMGDFDIVHALTWSDDFDLGQRVHEALERLQERGWGELDRDWVLKCVAAAVGLNPFRFNADLLAQKLKADLTAIDAVSSQMEAATVILHEMGIHGPGAIPYTHQFLFLTRLLGETAGAPLSAGQSQKVQQWIWQTAVLSFLGGLQHDRLARHWRAFKDWVLDDADAPTLYPEAEECRRYNFAHARSRFVALVLSHKNPCPPPGQPPFDAFAQLALHGNQASPALLARSGPGLRGFDRQSLRGLPPAALSGPANRIILPPGQLTPFREALSAHQQTPFAQLPSDFRAQLQSHAITQAAWQRLQDNDYAAFLEVRRRAVLALEESFLQGTGVKIEDKGPYPT